jgi:hypothetical protein
MCIEGGSTMMALYLAKIIILHEYVTGFAQCGCRFARYIGAPAQITNFREP